MRVKSIPPDPGHECSKLYIEWPAATAADPEKESLTPLVWTFAFERRVGDRFEHPVNHFLRSNVSFGTHFPSLAADFRDRRDPGTPLGSDAEACGDRRNPPGAEKRRRPSGVQPTEGASGGKWTT